MNSFKLKQPNKNTHEALLSETKKTKQIGKQEKMKKKVIRKKNQPSAIRLEAINETFSKLEKKSEPMIQDIDLGQENEQKLAIFLNFKKQQCKCECGKNIKYYCLKCMCKSPYLPFPSVKIPLQISVIHHESQKINKSSILPINFLCQPFNHFNTYFYSSNPSKQSQNQKILDSIKEKEGTYILYPHVESELVSAQNVKDIKNIVILDCTWFQTDMIINHLNSSGKKKFIRLENYQSVYWRYNHHNDKALSSAEALMYFMREYQSSQNLNIKEYDQLMFLYVLQLKIISNSWQQQKKQQQKIQQEGED